MSIICPKCKNKNGLVKLYGKISATIILDCSINRSPVIEVDPKQIYLYGYDEAECAQCGFEGSVTDFEVDDESSKFIKQNSELKNEHSSKNI